jgi:hypothetical protein
MKLSSQFPQQRLITDAWNFNTLFLLTCNIVEFVFVWMGCRLPLSEQCIWNIVYMKFLSNYSLQMLEILTHLSSGIPYGGVHYCVNWIPTSCLSVHISIECVWNLRHSFFSYYSSQMLEILAHSFGMPYGGIHFFTNLMCLLICQ